MSAFNVVAIELIGYGALACLSSGCNASDDVRASKDDGVAGQAGMTGAPDPSQSGRPGLTSCADAIATGGSSLLDDFEDGDVMTLPVEGRSGVWYSFTDGTLGSLQMAISADENGRALHLSGGGFSEWGAAAGVGVAWSSEKQKLCSYDASAYAGIRFRARGNAPLRVNVQTRATTESEQGGDCVGGDACFDQHGRTLRLTPTFRDYELDFCRLTPFGWGGTKAPFDPTEIVSLSFLVQSVEGFDVWVDDVGFVERDSEQAVGCSKLCPLEQVPDGVTPEPEESWLDLDDAGLSLYTFTQEVAACDPLTRRYLVHVPSQLAEASDAPIVIVLPGSGGDAESMHQAMTEGRFTELADRDSFIVVYANAAPGPAASPELPNGGAWRIESADVSDVDDHQYLEMIVADLAERSLISGDNQVFLTGLSIGGGMTLSAARDAPGAYAGIAPVMPFAGVVPMPPDPSLSYSLRRVLIAYAIDDPGHVRNYHQQLAPLAPEWAAALDIDPSMIQKPETTQLPDRVREGQDYTGEARNALNTRDSRAKQIDYGSADTPAMVRVLEFDAAGHFWPLPSPEDTQLWIDEWGFRNQDLDMADAVWDFFHSSL